MITTKSKINFSNLSVPPIIPAVQGDTGRVIQFELNDFTIPAEATATYYVQKPSGEAVYNEATISGNNVFVELTAQSIIEVGENYGQVRILVDEEVVTSFDFILLVKTFRGIEAVQSDTEMNIFDKAVERAQETIASTVTEAEAAIEAAAQEAEEYIAQAIDPTLSITDKAADAKVAGDALKRLAPAYSNSEQYVAGQLTLKDFLLYYRKNDAGSWGDESWKASNWQSTTLSGALLALFTHTIAPWWNRYTNHSVGELCVREQWLYRCKEPIEASAGSPATWDESKWEVVTVGEMLAALKEALTDVSATLTHKADKSGVVASAEQLLSDVGTEDKAPYLFRAAPYDSTRVDEEVVGCSVGWNQLVGSDTSSVTVTSGHKLYTVIGGTASIVASDGTAISVTGGTDTVIDLTAWFGSAIADYALTLETATAGSGVAFIKALLPGGYIPYSAPTLKSVEGLSGHKFVGFNAFDASTAVDGERWTASGTSSLSGTSRSVKIRCIPNATYYFKDVNGDSTSQAVYWFDADNNVIGYNGFDGSSPKSGTVTAPNNACYMAINMPTAYKSSTCINLSDPAKNGTYEPYEAHTYALDSDLTLRGILKMDADHNVYAEGDVYESDGTVNVRFDEVDLGTLNWVSQASTSGRYEMISNALVSVVKKADANTKEGNIICKAYTTIPRDNTYGGSVGISLSITGYLCVYDPNYGENDAASFKTAMSGVKLVYEKATPTTETADPYASPQNCEPGGTEEYVYAAGGSGIPVGHNSKYQKNLKGELERVSVAVPDAPSSNGTYTLKATVSSGTVTYSWVSD